MFLSILRILLICKFLICQLSVKVIYKQTVKNNDYWIFLISFTFTFVFFSGTRHYRKKDSSEDLPAHMSQSKTRTDNY